MKESSNKLKVFVYSTLGLTLLCVALFTISMFVSFDADIGYFARTPLTGIQSTLMIVSVIFFACIAFLIPKGSLPCEDVKGNRLTQFSSLLCGLVFIGITVLNFLSTYNSAAGLSDSQKNVFLIISVSGLLSSIYFIYDALASDKKAIAIQVISSIFIFINLLCTVISEHVDLFVPINAPRKNLLFLGCIATAMFIVQELKFKSGIHQPRAYVFFGSAATLLFSVLSIPSLIAHYAGAFKDNSFLVYYIIGLSLAIYAATRIVSYSKYASNKANED